MTAMRYNTESCHLALDMESDEMRIADPDVSRLADERDILNECLSLPGAKVLELGCGKADKTRLLAQTAASVLALEVDATQLANNQAAENPDNVRFAYGGAENIPAVDSSFDIVLMFKSLHHVPTALMDDAFSEIHRVLKPGGVAYISEPVYAGDFNDILRMFHDEKVVREAAFAAEVRAVSTKRLSLSSQTFFLQPMHFEDFSQFEDRILKVTHTDHTLSPALYDAVRSRFNQHLTSSGVTFHMPIRVDLFRKDGL
jgi:ubiquinone/menaquinone biosynthesis C-methylase UbiE